MPRFGVAPKDKARGVDTPVMLCVLVVKTLAGAMTACVLPVTETVNIVAVPTDAPKMNPFGEPPGRKVRSTMDVVAVELNVHMLVHVAAPETKKSVVLATAVCPA